MKLQAREQWWSSHKVALTAFVLACSLCLGCAALGFASSASADEDSKAPEPAAEEQVADEATDAAADEAAVDEATTDEAADEAADDKAATDAVDDAVEEAAATDEKSAKTYVDQLGPLSGYPTEGRFVEGVTALPGFYKNSEKNAANAENNEPLR